MQEVAKTQCVKPFRPLSRHLDPTSSLHIIAEQASLWVRAAEVGNDLFSVDIKCTPVSLISLLTTKTDRFGLPRFVECFKVKDIEIPVQSGAHPILVECLCILGAGDCGGRVIRVIVIGSASIRVSNINRHLSCHIPSVGQPVSPFHNSIEVVDPATLWI